MRTLLWFRGKDLRLGDHAALHAARNAELIPVFVLDDFFFDRTRARELPHRMQFLIEHHVGRERFLQIAQSYLGKRR